jgi:hypothetical protein
VVSADFYNAAGGRTVLVAEIETGTRYRASAFATETDFGVVLADRVVWLPVDMLGQPFGRLTPTQRDQIAQVRAEAAERSAAAERRTGEEHATAQRLRGELEQLRTDQRDELAQLRRDAAEERASLRAEATQQLRAVLAQLDPRRASAGAGADPVGGDDTAEPAGSPAS